MIAPDNPQNESHVDFLSLGAGIQSTAMALMAAHGEIEPTPQAAIFADTQWEPRAIYDHLDWLSSPNVLPFPIHRVTKGSVREAVITSRNMSGGRFTSVPYFTANGGMGRRQCTREHKIEPVEKKVRELLGFEPRQRIPEGSAIMWLGITTDEASRMKPARNRWQINRFPLIEKRMSRWDCILWLERNGYPVPPKSSCIGCPYHNDALWREMKVNDPASWDDAVEVDRVIRNPGRGMSQPQYMHRSRKPLDEVDLSTDEEKGQLNLFLDECEGMCGV